MLIIRENKLLAGIIGGLVLMVLIVILLTSGGSSDPDIPTSATDPSGTATSAASPATAGVESKNYAQLNCSPLLTFEEVEQAAGTAEFLEVSLGETCRYDSLSDDSVFVQIGPGRPGDFAEGATIIGVPGDPVAGVGDLALWFGGPTAEGGGAVGALAVAADTPLGALTYRIVVARPDLDSAQQLEVARTLALAALPRFPGTEPAPEATPEPIEVGPEDEPLDPLDQANQSYVANLLAREAAGEWTRAEGLVATLGLFAGETSTSRVAPARVIADQSATGIVRLARTFVAENPDAEQSAEIERLLDLLTPQPPPLDEAPVAANLDRSPVRPIALRTTRQSPDCYIPWPHLGDVCFYSARADEQYGDKYLLWYPDLDEWEGWTRGPSTVRDAMRRTANVLESFEGETPSIDVILGPNAGHSSVDFADDGICTVTLNKGAQQLRDRDPALLQQAVASAMSLCYLAQYGLSEAFESPVAWYISDVAFPNASMETVILEVPDKLRAEELLTTFLERSLTNMTFYEYVDSARGTDATIAAVAALAQGGPTVIEDIDRLFHDYYQALSDGVIADRGGAHAFVPGAHRYDLEPGLRIKTSPREFGADRVQVTVPAGMYACMEYPNAGNLDMVASWRPGTPGESGGSWSSDFPSSIQGTATFLVTTTLPDGRFDLRVSDIADNPDCEDDDDGSSASDVPDPPCGLCDGTWYFWTWEVVTIN